MGHSKLTHRIDLAKFTKAWNEGLERWVLAERFGVPGHKISLIAERARAEGHVLTSRLRIKKEPA